VVIKCTSCSKSAALNCSDCNDSYCKDCYKSLHCKGVRRSHTSRSISYCSQCSLQMASKFCKTCYRAQAKRGSIQALMCVRERGLYCDTCFEDAHNRTGLDHDDEVEEPSFERLEI
jgi:hypothetical protein